MKGKRKEFAVSWKRLVIFLIGGVLAVFLSVLEAGVGHGTYLPASALFPWAMLLMRFSAVLSMIVALIQWPLYSLYIDRFEERIPLVVGLAMAHMAAAVIALIAMY